MFFCQPEISCNANGETSKVEIGPKVTRQLAKVVHVLPWVSPSRSWCTIPIQICAEWCEGGHAAPCNLRLRFRFWCCSPAAFFFLCLARHLRNVFGATEARGGHWTVYSYLASAIGKHIFKSGIRKGKASPFRTSQWPWLNPLFFIACYLSRLHDPSSNQGLTCQTDTGLKRAQKNLVNFQMKLSWRNW